MWRRAVGFSQKALTNASRPSARGAVLGVLGLSSAVMGFGALQSHSSCDGRLFSSRSRDGVRLVPQKLKDKVVLITGAGSGIGKAAAAALAREGCSLVLCGRRLDALKEVADAVQREHGTKCLVVQADVTSKESVENLFAQINKEFGRLDVLFNNAGVFPAGVLFEDISLDDWERTLATNLTGSFLCSQQAFKIMSKQSPMGGRIINNGSISAHTPRPNSAPYTSTKHAISGLTKSLSLDGRKYNIACGQIDVGNARTEMVANLSKSSKGTPQPNGELMVEPTFDVNEVAEAIVFMASQPPEANVLFMTIMANAMPYVGRG